MKCMAVWLQKAVNMMHQHGGYQPNVAITSLEIQTCVSCTGACALTPYKKYNLQFDTSLKCLHHECLQDTIDADLRQNVLNG